MNNVENLTYPALVSCLNCCFKWKASYRRGTKIASTKIECPNCGVLDVAQLDYLQPATPLGEIKT